MWPKCNCVYLFCRRLKTWSQNLFLFQQLNFDHINRQPIGISNAIFTECSVFLVVGLDGFSYLFLSCFFFTWFVCVVCILSLMRFGADEIKLGKTHWPKRLNYFGSIDVIFWFDLLIKYLMIFIHLFLIPPTANNEHFFRSVSWNFWVWFIRCNSENMLLRIEHQFKVS